MPKVAVPYRRTEARGGRELVRLQSRYMPKVAVPYVTVRLRNMPEGGVRKQPHRSREAEELGRGREDSLDSWAPMTKFSFLETFGVSIANLSSLVALWKKFPRNDLPSQRQTWGYSTLESEVFTD